jgi:hypothetical protein
MELRRPEPDGKVGAQRPLCAQRRAISELVVAHVERANAAYSRPWRKPDR